MKPHPHRSEFDRIDALPTLDELLADLRECFACLLGSASLTWR